ncbi:ABC transporter permease [Bradyrhizobium jicamae]|nr:ABC transporter permease [Bradyrhizobium jicamae]
MELCIIFGGIALLERQERVSQLGLAVADFAAALRLWPLWTRLGWNDILYRYRRSTLGPFWSTVNVAVTVIALGLVYSEIFKLPVRQLMPFVCAGLIVWSFISAILLEAGGLFSGSESYIKQVRLPYTLYVFRFVFSKIMLFLHDIPIYLVLLLYFQIWPGLALAWAIPGFVLLSINCTFASLAIGMASARFRDIPRIIASLTQVLFLVTPIIWMPDLLGSRHMLAAGNPFFHLIEIVRAPLLGMAPSTDTIMVMLAMTVLNMLVTATVFLRFRARIAYWI